MRCGAPRRRAFRSRGHARFWCAPALALTAVLALAAPAVAVLEPVTPDDDAVVGLRPTFSWLAGPGSSYEVYVELPSGPVKAAESPTLTATSTVALPDDTRLRWFVRAVSVKAPPDTARTNHRRRVSSGSATVEVAVRVVDDAASATLSGPDGSSTYTW